MKKILIATALAAAASASFAQVSVGVGAGFTRLSLPSEACTDGVRCDKTDVGGKIFANYDLAKVVPVAGLSAEVAYTSFGKAESTFTDGVDFGKDEAKVSALSLSAVYRYTVNPTVGVSAKLGIARVNGDLKSTVNGMRVFSDDFSSTKPIFGLSVDYAITPTAKAFLFADFTRLKIEVDGDSGSFNSRLIGAGVQFAF